MTSVYYSVVPLPSGLAWGVASPHGDVLEAFAKRGRALERVAELNGQLARDQAQAEAFYAANAAEYIRRTR